MDVLYMGHELFIHISCMVYTRFIEYYNRLQKLYKILLYKKKMSIS